MKKVCECGHSNLVHSWHGCVRWTCRCPKTSVELVFGAQPAVPVEQPS